MSGRKISRSESLRRFHFAERTVQRRWSGKSQRLSGPHRSRKVISTNPNQPRRGNPSPSGKVG